jgi:hypothetical protein
MSVKIGKLMPDGKIRHIDLFSGGMSESTIFTLKNFYTTEKRVDALLDLGNLSHIGPSPYGRCTDEYDFVHCYAAIRDNGANKKKNEAYVVEDKRMFANLAEVGYLYENGKWTILIGERSESIEFSQVLELIKWQPFRCIRIYEFQENKLSEIHTPFLNWDAMRTYADKENKALYIFRNNRLATAINHPLTKKAIA